MRRSSPHGSIPVPHLVSVGLDDFTYYSLKDMANECYRGNISRTIRECVKKALEEWDKGHV